MSLMWHAGEPIDGILWVEIDWVERPVNALSRATLAELSQLLARIRGDASIRGVVGQSAPPAETRSARRVSTRKSTIVRGRPRREERSAGSVTKRAFAAFGFGSR